MDNYEYRLAMRQARREILAITQPATGDTTTQGERIQTALFTVLGIMAELEDARDG
jgi:hypothetical protein